MAIASLINSYIVFTYREFLTEATPSKPWIEYFRMDEARVNEWKAVLANPHLTRQDSHIDTSYRTYSSNYQTDFYA